MDSKIDESLESVVSWFNACGGTDEDYLRSHYSRFLDMRTFALEGKSLRSMTIIDMGAHWLHNALFYANSGHKLICCDASLTFRLPNVHEAAKRMNATLHFVPRMDKSGSLKDVDSDSIDMILFGEIIEHLAFNPVPFWKEAYRVLKPGGSIIITTPNAFYYRWLPDRIDRLLSGASYGPTVKDIFGTGTMGHHWKEFTLAELQAYFHTMSDDFEAERHRMHYLPGDEHLPDLGYIEKQIARRIDIRAQSMFLEVTLRAKQLGFKLEAPWEIE